jgi:hypothetical protein
MDISPYASELQYRFLQSFSYGDIFISEVIVGQVFFGNKD